jgi:hypothetical protein
MLSKLGIDQMLSTIQIIAATLMAFLALLFTIARATPDEKAKVIGWGRQSAYVALLLCVMGTSMFSIHDFVTGDTPPNRWDIAGFAFSTLIFIWYSILLVAHISDMLSADRRKNISILQAEVADLKEERLKLQIEEIVLKRMLDLSSAELKPSSMTIESSEDGKAT